MGCGNTRERIENKILILQLTRYEIQQERTEILKRYEEITGCKLVRPKIQDYVIDKFETQNNIY